MNEPTNLEIIDHVAEHFGLTKTRVIAILKVPTHPQKLRDTFAGQAMQAVFTGCASRAEMVAREDVAQLAYMLADAMLERRAQ